MAERTLVFPMTRDAWDAAALPYSTRLALALEAGIDHLGTYLLFAGTLTLTADGEFVRWTPAPPAEARRLRRAVLRELDRTVERCAVKLGDALAAKREDVDAKRADLERALAVRANVIAACRREG